MNLNSWSAVCLFVLAFSIPARAEDPPAAVVVALLDTGIDATHPGLAESLLPAINAVEPGKPVDDPDAHGTVLAGLIAGQSAKPEERGWAAGYPVRVLPIKVANDGVATPGALVAGIDAALQEKASVICIALAACTSTVELDAALDRARQAGVIVVAPAGSVHPDFGGFDAEPAAHPWVVSCTASRVRSLELPDGRGVAAGGARGEQVSAGCAATGETELMLPDDATSLPIKGVPAEIRGTSVSCARAAALAAILRSSRPDLSASRVREILVTAGGLAEAPAEQATERLRKGSREGVLRWAAKREGPAGDVFIAGIRRAIAPGGALRLLVEVGNLGDAPLAGRLEVEPPGGRAPVAAEFEALPPSGRATFSFDLEDVAFDAVAVVRIAAEADMNPENNVARVVCFPPADSGVEIHRLRLTGRHEGGTKATAGARLWNARGEPREVVVTAGIGKSAAKDRFKLPAYGYVDVELEFDLPAEPNEMEAPFVMCVTAGEARVALAGAMVELGPAEFVPRLDGSIFKRRLHR